MLFIFLTSIFFLSIKLQVFQIENHVYLCFFYPRVITHHSDLYLVGIRNIRYSCKAGACFSLLEIEEKKNLMCVF